MGLHDQEYRFCPVCGQKKEKRNQTGRASIGFACANCGFIHYSDPKLVAGAILEIDHRLLLVKRACPPQKGKYNLPGGYIDRGEEPKAAVMREMDEECGIRVRVNELIGVYASRGNPVVLIVYRVDYLAGELRLNHENTAGGFFSRKELPWAEIGFQSTKEALKDYLQNMTK